MNTPLALPDLRKDEYNINFDDTRTFAVERYKDILKAFNERYKEIVKAINEDILPHKDRATSTESREFQTIQEEIQNKRLDPGLSHSSKLHINQLQPLPRTLNDLVRFFEHAVYPEKPQMDILWGLVDLNLKLSYDSAEKLKKTAEWTSKLRRTIELFNRCLESCKDWEINEARMAIVDALVPLLSAFAASVEFLKTTEKGVASQKLRLSTPQYIALTQRPLEEEVNASWQKFEKDISFHISELNGIAIHLSELTKISQANPKWIQKKLLAPEAADAYVENNAIFPIQMLPYPRNTKFYGRERELNKINQALSWRIPGNDRLRTFLIYGRRGVGKTEIALEYAYSNPDKFDAIFWVGCETSLSLGQSFTNIAKMVNISGADRQGQDEENHLAVLQWLKQTTCRWLMIFDNAEKEQLLKTYWPLGASGSILITSRGYRNFFNDEDRKGDTVIPFPPDQSFDFLCHFLSDDWRDVQQRHSLKMTEVAAAEEFLQHLEWLPLAINLAASLIQNGDIGGVTIKSTLELFKEYSAQLPERYLGKRSETYHALDTLWDMVFRQLPENARELLKVLSFLLPDTTYIDLFLPRHQAVLDGKLSFCKQNSKLVDDEQILLTSIVAPTQALEDALAALLEAQLLKRDDRVLGVGHQIQEAVNHPILGDLQDSFDAAVRLVAEAFPKRHLGIPLFEQWATCAKYIHDGNHLAMKFEEYYHSPVGSRLNGTDELVELIGNCAWYLYEISKYDEALQIVDIGYHACKDMESLQYADLCNTAGVCYLEKNFLKDCRNALETSLRIQERILSPNDIEIAASTHNLGNLETATGNYEKAMEYFDRSVNIRLVQGDTAANQLALLFLCMGRVYTLKRDFDMAIQTLSKAERSFLQVVGEKDHFMAHVHYAYGNVAYRSSNWPSARLHYTKALDIALATNRIHPITAAAHMSLGNVEYKLKNIEEAKSHLKEALAIAELRSPTRDDGTVARILYVLSRVMSENALTASMAEDLRVRAENARTILLKAGESVLVDAYEQDGHLDLAEEAYLYDALVPIFFR